MRYAVPVNAADEVGVLASAGADELYCGYQDAWWVKRYGDHDSASRRQGAANFATLEDLGRCVEGARVHGLPVWLALNARYTEPQLDRLVWLCRRFEAMGGTGIIASDLGLFWRLRSGTGLRRCLSLLAVAQNVQTLLAYQRLGISRVVLPRFVGADEAARLIGAVPGMEAECMAFFDKCPWVDGYCRHRHGVTYPTREAPEGADDAPPLYTFDTTYQTHACLGRACTYLEPYPCAACFLPRYERAGVGVAKLGGRGRSLDERLHALRFLRTAEGLGSDDARARLYRKTFDDPCACYYGDTIQQRSSIQPVEEPEWARVVAMLGSQTDRDSYRQALGLLMAGNADGAGPWGLLVPPLSEDDLEELMAAVPHLSERFGERLVLYVNDLGTMVALARMPAVARDGCTIGVGTLLARTDDPKMVARALDPRLNPLRAVWTPDGMPRMLTYREPPRELVTHWRNPSLFEHSAQEALRMLISGEE